MLTFPIEIPSPKSGSYDFEPVDVVERTTGEQGDMRARSRAIVAPYYVSPTWECTDETCEVLRNFHDVALNNGADRFYWPMFNGKNFKTVQAQFAAKPSFKEAGWRRVDVSSRLYVRGQIGPVLWQNLLVGDQNTDITIETLSGFTPTRVDIYTRTGFNGTSPTVDVGWTVGTGGASAELAESVPVATTGVHTIVTAGAAYAGTALGVLQATSRAVKVRLSVTGTPTVGSVAVVVTYI